MSRQSEYLVDLMIRNLLWMLKRLPYERRIPVGGHIMSHVITPFTDMRTRILHNIDLALPEIDPDARQAICRSCLDNFGRMFSEFYSFPEFHLRASGFEISGDGYDSILESRKTNRPVMLVSGHYGNFHACPALLRSFGHPVAVMYQHMKNRYFDRHYVHVLKEVGDPAFARGRRGTMGFIRHLRNGGIVAALNDQHDLTGTVLEFMGIPARTSISLARIALDNDAMLVPSYGIRRHDGLGFRVVFEAPIPHTDPLIMTQQLNDSLEGMVRAHPEQWYWIHRRWKGVPAQP